MKILRNREKCQRFSKKEGPKAKSSGQSAANTANGWCWHVQSCIALHWWVKSLVRRNHNALLCSEVSSYTILPASASVFVKCQLPCNCLFLEVVRCSGDRQCQLPCDSYFEVRCSGDGKCRGGFDLLIEVLTGMRGQLLMGWSSVQLCASSVQYAKLYTANALQVQYWRR